MDSRIGNAIGVRDVILSALSAGSFVILPAGMIFMPPLEPWGWQQAFGRVALLAAPTILLALIEQRRLMQFGRRVEERHPGILIRHRLRWRALWLAADSRAFAAVVREEGLEVDPAFAAEAKMVRTMERASWVAQGLAIAAFVAGIAVRALWSY